MSFAAFLLHALAQRKARNPSYSLRAFARDLSCDHATLSQWMREKRPLTQDALERLCERLGVTGPAIEYAIHFDPFDLVVLQTATAMEGPTVAGIADACGCDMDTVNISISRLLRLRMLTMEGARWTAPERDF